MKYILFLFLPFILISAELIEVTADSIEANNNKTIAKGNVRIKQGTSRLFANNVEVTLNEARKPIKFEATGAVKLFGVSPKGVETEGNADMAIYHIESDVYELIGRAVVFDENNSVKGESIIIDRKTNEAKVIGSQQMPARVVFLFEDKNNSLELNKSK